MNPGEGTTATAIVEASLNEVFESLVSIDQYPTWLTAIKSAKIIESDDSGRPSKVELKIDAGMLKDRVTLDYDWSAAPEKISFSLDEADLMTRMDGEYVLKSLGDETQVSYQLFVEVSLPVPRMMIAKGEEATAKQALKELADKFA